MFSDKIKKTIQSAAKALTSFKHRAFIAEVATDYFNVTAENQQADTHPLALRISVDTKAKVKIGDFSRNGKTRANEAPQGLDHDYAADALVF